MPSFEAKEMRTNSFYLSYFFKAQLTSESTNDSNRLGRVVT